MTGHRFRLAATLGLALYVVACSEPTLDSSDLEASALRVRRGLDAARQREFDEAIDLVRMIQRGAVPGVESVAIDGLTGAELLIEVDRVELRREIAAVEGRAALHQELLAETDRLTELSIEESVFVAPDEGGARVKIRARNGTGRPLESGFVRLSIGTPANQALYKTEEYVAFSPPLRPEERRDLEIRVSRDFGRIFLSTPEATLSTRFTSFQGGRDFVVEEPSQRELERAERALVEARAELVRLNAKLAAL